MYYHSLTEKYRIPEIRTLRSGSIHKKMLITSTSAKQAQRPNTLYCESIHGFIILGLPYHFINVHGTNINQLIYHTHQRSQQILLSFETPLKT